MVRASALRKKDAPAPRPDTVNASGGLAYKGDLYQDALALLTTSVITNTVTLSQEKLADDTVSVLTALAKVDPDFLAKAVTYARHEGLMRLAPIAGLAALITFGRNRVLARAAFFQVIRTPDDLRELVTMFNDRVFGKRMTGWVTRLVADWLNLMTEYHAVKYGSKASKTITLRDILRLAHPHPLNETQDHIFYYLTRGVKEISPKEPDNLKVIWAAEKLKTAKSDEERIDLITRFRLPWEVVIPTLTNGTSPKLWAAMAKVMPYFALVRNLATLQRNGAFDLPGVTEDVVVRLSDPKAIAASRMFPFRFFQAKRTATSIPTEVGAALSDALELSVNNLPPINGKVVVAVDESGSMNASSMGEYTDLNCSEIARLLAAILYRRYDATVLVFNTEAKLSVGHVKANSVMAAAQTIDRFSGGTNLASPVRYLRDKKIPCDTYVCLSDNESYVGYPVADEFRLYRAAMNRKTQGFLFNLSPTQTYQASIADPLLRVISGFGDQALKMIAFQSQTEGRGQVEYVRGINVFSYSKPDSD